MYFKNALNMCIVFNLIYLKNIAIFHFGYHAKKREIPPNISIIEFFETRSYMKWHFNFP